MNGNKFLLLVFSLGIILFLISAAEARHIVYVDIEPTEINPGDEFKVKVRVKETQYSKKVVFYLDDKEFCSKNVGGDEIFIYSDTWDLSENPLDCGIHKVRVEIRKMTNELLDEEEITFTIGNVPSLSIIPEKPILGDHVILKFTDSETNESIKGLEVKIYYAKDGISSAKRKRTLSNGEIMYLPMKIGEYKVVVLDDYYCGKFSFWVKKNMIVDGPHPSNPVVGQLISLVVPPGVGVKILDSEGGIYKRCYTGVGGGVNFTIEDPGNYTIVVGELSAEYWGTKIPLRVYEKLPLEIKIYPPQPVVNRVVTISAYSNGKPVEDIKILLSKPTSTSPEIYFTNSNGTITFLPLTTGEYAIRIEDERYESLIKNFKVLNELHINLPRKEFHIDEEIEMVVTDQNGLLIGGASIVVGNGLITGLTNSEGKYKFSIKQRGEFEIKVNKKNYWPSSTKIKVLGLMELSNPLSVEVENPITFVVLDRKSSSELEDVRISVLTPDNRIITLRNKTYIPTISGKHIVMLQKEGYESENYSFEVLPHPIAIDTFIEDGKLWVRVTSRNNSIEGMKVVVNANQKIFENVTNNIGIATFNILGEGNYEIIVNTPRENPNYASAIKKIKIVKEYDYLLLFIPVGLVAIVAIIAILLPSFAQEIVESQLKKGEEEKEKRRPSLSKV